MFDITRNELIIILFITVVLYNRTVYLKLCAYIAGFNFRDLLFPLLPPCLPPFLIASVPPPFLHSSRPPFLS